MQSKEKGKGQIRKKRNGCGNANDNNQKKIKLDNRQDSHERGAKTPARITFSSISNKSLCGSPSKPEKNNEVRDKDTWLNCLKESEGPLVRAIPFERFILDQEIGKGSFGVVTKAICTVGHQQVALKRLGTHTSRARILSEITTLKLAWHPHIIKLVGVTQDNSNLSLVLEYVHGSNLAQVLFDSHTKKDYCMSYRNLVDVAHQVTKAVHYLHSPDIGICHNDLKPANIIIDSKTKNAKLCDFGLAYKIEENNNFMHHNVTLVIHECVAQVGKSNWNQTMDWDNGQFNSSTILILPQEAVVNDHKCKIEELLTGKIKFMPEKNDSTLDNMSSNKNMEDTKISQKQKRTDVKIDNSSVCVGLPNASEEPQVQPKKMKLPIDMSDIESMRAPLVRVIPRKHLYFGDPLHEGSYGTVIRGTYLTGHYEVAIKKFSGPLQMANDNVAHEAIIMCNIDHTNIVSFIGVMQDDDRLNIVMEKMYKFITSVEW
ncbi:hypothetical protein QAD02_019838 [Eretmocerus hayati]|uniref:Uncharacterized protein n=1 Tax=Eretmocerus hayati TaxID=131215 RepID=A0ACC2PLX2_9HYME|nr:hypothetical protein QAD02_019838 [Eretmocerus hayati]